MYRLIKHKFSTIFPCNQKVCEYLKKHIHARVEEIGSRFTVCFGEYPDRQSALTAKQALDDMGVNAKISEVRK